MLRKYDVAVVMAGNGKDQPNEIPRLLAPILKENTITFRDQDSLMVVRTVKNPFLRKMFSRLFPFVWTFMTKFQCTDVTNGFRAYKLKHI